MEFYEIKALAPPDSSAETLRLMLRSALQTRLGLKVHFEDRELPVLALMVAKDGPKLTPANGSKTSGKQSVKANGYHADSISLDFLASGYLTNHLGRPVLDKTGLPGQYTIDLSWSEAPNPADRRPDDFGDLSSGLKALGLRLEKAKEKVRFLVVDYVNKDPTAN
jgi:uncharacterized protein (TIGR03435 family)